MKKIFRTTVVCMLAASPSFAQTRTPPQYTVTDLGPVGGPPGQPFVIRDNGLIAGAASVSATAWHAVLWYQGLKFDIGNPAFGGSSSAFGVNDWGQAVGGAETSSADPYGEDFCGFGTSRTCRPFLWEFGLMRDLPLLKDKTGATGANAIANVINNRSQAAGTAENTTRDSTCPPINPAAGQTQVFQFKPVIWQNGTVQELATIGGDPDGIVFAMNDAGQAVGATGSCTAFQANGNLTYLNGLHATIWHNGMVTDLGNLGGISAGGGNTAININNRSQVVGSSGTPDGSFHGFLWSWETGIQDVGTVGDDVASVSLGINDRGDVTGISFDADFNPRAFLRLAGGRPVDVNSLVTGGSPLFMFDACSINARGQIIGIAVDSAGDFHGYLASPDNSGGSSAGQSAVPSSVQFESARRLLRQRLAFSPFGARPFTPR